MAKGTVKVKVEDIVIGEILTNRSLCVDEALTLLQFNESEFLEEHGWDDIDYNEIYLDCD